MLIILGTKEREVIWFDERVGRKSGFLRVRLELRKAREAMSNSPQSRQCGGLSDIMKVYSPAVDGVHFLEAVEDGRHHVWKVRRRVVLVAIGSCRMREEAVWPRLCWG